MDKYSNLCTLTYQYLIYGESPNVSALFGHHDGILLKATHENC
jgi:hypothetical protein